MRGQVLLVVSLLAFSVVVASAPAEAGSDGGGRIAVIVGESGDVGPTPRLVIMDADGENARVLGWILDASLSPSGRVVAYESRTVTPEIWVAAADRRGGARRLVRNGRDAAWSPNGGAIAFVRGRRPGCCDHLDLWLGDLYSRTQRLLLRKRSDAGLVAGWQEASLCPGWGRMGRGLGEQAGSAGDPRRC